MNQKLENFKENIKNKKIAVLGIGRSNIPAIKYLNSLGANISARDIKPELSKECSELEKLNIEFVLGEDYLDGLSDYDFILRSPGIKPFLPEINEAVKNGVNLTSEIELLIELAPCKIIGVTGSDGKTTTTTLISKFLEKANYKVWLGGNIGYPVFTKIEEMKQKDIVVLELSSFQLMTLKNSPNISIITNISPNHLDYHRGFDEYIEAKANIFMCQNEGDILVLNDDNKEFTTRYEEKIKINNIKSEIRKFSLESEVSNGVYLKDDQIIANIKAEDKKICEVKDIKLVGMHNVANICTAASAVIHMTGIEPIKEVVTTFAGVQHRMEFARQVNGVKWYNDSIGTSPSRTIAGLISFDSKIILIAGGYDKNIPYDVLGGYILDKVKILILFGATAPKIEEAIIKEANKRNVNVSDYVKIINYNNLEECVDYAYKNSIKGDNVVMSPASASFGLYKDFEERGNHFKDLVNKL